MSFSSKNHTNFLVYHSFEQFIKAILLLLHDRADMIFRPVCFVLGRMREKKGEKGMASGAKALSLAVTVNVKGVQIETGIYVYSC